MNDTNLHDTNTNSSDGSERLEEKPRDVLRELVGLLSDHQLDREPPTSEVEMGECEGLELAVDEIQYIIENGDVRPPNTDAGSGDSE